MTISKRHLEKCHTQVKVEKEPLYLLQTLLIPYKTVSNKISVERIF